MSNRKTIFAIVLFIAFGLFIYSFANPDTEQKLNDNDNKNTEQNEKINNSENQNVNDVDDKEGIETVGQEEETEEQEVNIPGNLVERTRPTPTVPTPVLISYSLLEEAIKAGEKIISSKEVKEFVKSVVEELGGEIGEGQLLLTSPTITQDAVNEKTDTITELIARVNTHVEEKLEESVKTGNLVLSSMIRISNTTFDNVLNNLKNNVEDLTIKNKELKDKVLFINNVNSLINKVRQLEEDLLSQIAKATLHLSSDTNNIVNTDIRLTLITNIENQDLVSSYKILDKKRNVLSTDEPATITKNGAYTAHVTFVNGEEKISEEFVIDNIDKEAPIAKITSPSADGKLFGKNVVITGEVDASEENIKSHWFEIKNPDGTTSTSHNLNTSELSYSFKLDTSKGSGEYKIRYVATDKAGNRSDAHENSNKVIRTLNVDVANPETTIEVSEVRNGKFTVSGLAKDNNRLNRVYVQLVSRKTNTRCGGTTVNLLKPNQMEAKWSVEYDVQDLGENCKGGYFAAHVSVTNNLGNSSASGWTKNFYVDVTNPETTIEVSEVNQGRFTVSGIASDDARLNRVYVQLVSRKTNARCGGTTISLLSPAQQKASWFREYDVRDLALNCPDGYYAATVSVTDQQGNSRKTGWTENFLVDGTAPNLVLEENETVNVEYGSNYNKFGYYAIDNIDGDLTENVSVSFRFQEQGGSWQDREFKTDKLGLYKIWYTVTDNQGNETKMERKIRIVDTTAPNLNVKSMGSYTYDYGKSTYIEHGATAIDSVDGEVEVAIEGTINDKVAGVHIITYTAVDKSGNKATYERPIFIRPLVTAPANFTHELGDEFIAPKATVTISETEIFEIDPLHYSWKPNKTGEYKLEYQYLLKTDNGDIRSPGKKTIVNVVDTIKPNITFGEPNVTKNYEKECLWKICMTYHKSTDASIAVNVEDNSDIVELKYLWLPSSKIVNAIMWETEKLWEISKNFNNNSNISKTFEDGQQIFAWKLWIYAKDASGNMKIVSSKTIH